MAAELKPIDVICQHSRDGKITPMKIRVIDEDGEYQEYKIKGYNIIMRNNIGFLVLFTTRKTIHHTGVRTENTVKPKCLYRL